MFRAWLTLDDNHPLHKLAGLWKILENLSQLKDSHDAAVLQALRTVFLCYFLGHKEAPMHLPALYTYKVFSSFINQS